MYVGVHEDRTPGETAVRFPGATLTREFIAGPMKAQSLVAKVERACRPSWSAGMIPMVSFKPEPGDVHAGLWTRYLAELGRFLAENGTPTVVIVYHEPEDNMAGETFAAMFNRCRLDLKNAHAGLAVGYSAMAYQWRPSSRPQSTTDAAPWQRVEADVYGIDVYSGNTWPTETILPEHPGFIRWYDHMIRPYPGRKWTVTERGFKGDPVTRAAAIAREAAWLVGQPLCEGYVYWNSPGTERDDMWLLDPDGEAALRHLVAAVAGSPPIPPQPEPTREYVPLNGHSDLTLHVPTGVVVGDVTAHRAWWEQGMPGPAAVVARPSPRPVG